MALEVDRPFRDLRVTNRFRKDVKLAKKRKKNLGKLEVSIDAIRDDQELPASARPHKLSGDWSNFWECHIESDWLLIYRIEEGDVEDGETAEVLWLHATGTHADLFR